MKEVTTRYVGMDVHKATITVAVADDGAQPVIFGTVANDPGAVRKLVSQLKRRQTWHGIRSRSDRLRSPPPAGRAGRRMRRGCARTHTATRRRPGQDRQPRRDYVG